MPANWPVDVRFDRHEADLTVRYTLYMAHKPRKRFGQNFLHDQGVLQRIVDAIYPREGEHLVEIGPGQGALTTRLLPQVGKMDAIELDRDLLGPLQATCAPLGELTLHAADALKFDFCQLQSSPEEKLRVVGNLPYNISSPLLFHLLEQRHCIRDMHFMLQKEVVQRITAQPGSSHYGRLGIMLQYYCETEMLFTVAPGAFFPPPKVDSAVFRLIPYQTLPYPADDEELLSRVVAKAFGQRRKTLRNNLKGMMDADTLNQLGIDPGLRPEQISLPQFVQITNWLAQHRS